MTTDRPVAVFRADASARIGGGHVTRCLTLASALAGAGWHVGFAVNASAAAVVPPLAATVADILVLGAEDEASAMAQRWPGGATLLVVDHYARDAAFEQRCRPWAGAILAIDDLADRRHQVDFLLDPTHGREEADYRALTGPDCRLLLGARFALLRPQFRACRPRALARRAGAAPARRLLVSFGAADASGAAAPALAAVAAACPDLAVDVVVGSSARHLGEIERRAAAMSPAVRVHRSVGDMAALMTEADFAVGAAGGTAWERCCLGLPALVVVTAENQRRIAQNLAAAGAVEVLGDAGEVGTDALAARLAALRDDAPRRRAMARAAAAVCDGDGTARVAALLTRATMAAVRPAAPTDSTGSRRGGLSVASA